MELMVLMLVGVAISSWAMCVRGGKVSYTKFLNDRSERETEQRILENSKFYR